MDDGRQSVTDVRCPSCGGSLTEIPCHKCGTVAYFQGRLKQMAGAFTFRRLLADGDRHGQDELDLDLSELTIEQRQRLLEARQMAARREACRA